MPAITGPFFDYFTKPNDADNRVLIGSFLELDGERVQRTPIVGDDTVLVARAETEGKTTWDEDTICAEHDLTRKERPTE